MRGKKDATIYIYMPRKKIQPDDEELNRDFQF